MKSVTKQIAMSVAVLAALLSAFAAGRWTGRLQSTLSADADYPWDLHRKIGSMGFTCEKLISAQKSGRFVVETMDDGATLVVVSFNRSNGYARAWALDSTGRYATDSWTVDCK